MQRTAIALYAIPPGAALLSFVIAQGLGSDMWLAAAGLAVLAALVVSYMHGQRGGTMEAPLAAGVLIGGAAAWVAWVATHLSLNCWLFCDGSEPVDNVTPMVMGLLSLLAVVGAHYALWSTGRQTGKNEA